MPFTYHGKDWATRPPLYIAVLGGRGNRRDTFEQGHLSTYTLHGVYCLTDRAVRQKQDYPATLVHRTGCTHPISCRDLLIHGRPAHTRIQSAVQPANRTGRGPLWTTPTAGIAGPVVSGDDPTGSRESRSKQHLPDPLGSSVVTANPLRSAVSHRKNHPVPADHTVRSTVSTHGALLGADGKINC